MVSTTLEFNYRFASLADLDALVVLENNCFVYDKLSKRSFRHWIKANTGVLLVAETVAELNKEVVGYGLVWCHKGTRLARLYSLAISPKWRGQNIAKQLLTKLETETLQRKRYFLRLEVSKTNVSAISLYESLGYRIFGEFSDYYEDHSDAYRMQKQLLRKQASDFQNSTQWYQQTTEFTCGPASLMMAMNSLDNLLVMEQRLELDLWRESTTIFMTSGHGGCHPVGLANAAKLRGFEAKVFLNQQTPLFIDGVRSLHKKNIMERVHQQFMENADIQKVGVEFCDIDQLHLTRLLSEGYAIIMLISTYRLDGKKAPHWVTITGFDELCFYVNDPDLDEKYQLPIDCQYLPISRENFDKMSMFGSGKLRTAVALKLSESTRAC
ncbi:GNAT family N-acetyltransferase/peptidase C39 family protein [Thalassotalea piscium]|uniref:Ribosomal protein S18 acetylase RimI-like enzyme n=1 Tax=Thalassotalea piscium TaxID=1230533 RepID=A0A7X0NK53_9GAMM|nr:GNAT family N-acetyltransferase/peptidase C39 family protein [Thalassotalea piscium]MBB6544909.1 ribosomal protein S18 acetylase RimI-like enzyme [Thalassotalea piscium]